VRRKYVGGSSEVLDVSMVEYGGSRHSYPGPIICKLCDLGKLFKLSVP
jgi:hypothetical protein